MNNELLSKRMATALRILREECDYEDAHKGGTENYILSDRLSPGIGDRTLSGLIELGFIKVGPSRWCDETGYRITESGRKAFKNTLRE